LAISIKTKMSILYKMTRPYDRKELILLTFKKLHYVNEPYVVIICDFCINQPDEIHHDINNVFLSTQFSDELLLALVRCIFVESAVA
jgi:hypothetical protein